MSILLWNSYPSHVNFTLELMSCVPCVINIMESSILSFVPLLATGQFYFLLPAMCNTWRSICAHKRESSCRWGNCFLDRVVNPFFIKRVAGGIVTWRTLMIQTAIQGKSSWLHNLAWQFKGRSSRYKLQSNIDSHDYKLYLIQWNRIYKMHSCLCHVMLLNGCIFLRPCRSDFQIFLSKVHFSLWYLVAVFI